MSYPGTVGDSVPISTSGNNLTNIHTADILYACTSEFCHRLCSDVKNKNKLGLGPHSKLPMPDQ